MFLLIFFNSDCTELYQLADAGRQVVVDHSMQISRFIKEELGADKINIGAIGNIVSQLHVHIVGRRRSDVSWPGVVWGAEPYEAYSLSDLGEIKEKYNSYF